MIMIKLPQFLSVGLCCVILYACALDFGAGGASIEGSGNGRPPPPGFNHAGNISYNLFLSGIQQDQCGLVKRELEFFNPIDYNSVERDQTYSVSIKKDKKINIDLSLFLTNLSHQAISVQYPKCDVPIELYQTDTRELLFPRQQCDEVEIEILEPDQSRAFKLTYAMSTELNGIWQLSQNFKLFSDSGQELECEVLQAPMKLELKQDK